jgi:hypothetical protein
MNRFPAFIVALTALFTCAASDAAVLANYPFTSAFNPFVGSRASTDTDPDTTASTFDGGPGFQTAGSDNSAFDLNHGNPAPSLAIDATFTDGTSQAAAVTANDYFTFTITPTAGIAFNVSSLSFDYANYSSSTFPVENFFVRSSADGFANNLAAAVTASAASAGTFSTATINLSGNSSLQNVTSTLEFRLYVYDSTSTSGRGALVDNIVVNGTTAAVPEPATTALLGMGVLIAARQLIRSRRK